MRVISRREKIMPHKVKKALGILSLVKEDPSKRIDSGVYVAFNNGRKYTLCVRKDGYTISILNAKSSDYKDRIVKIIPYADWKSLEKIMHEQSKSVNR